MTSVKSDHWVHQPGVTNVHIQMRAILHISEWKQVEPNKFKS